MANPTVGIKFFTYQVRALCGGSFPETSGFNWSEVDHFKFEDGAFEPYNGFDEILPGPSLVVEVTEHGC